LEEGEVFYSQAYPTHPSHYHPHRSRDRTSRGNYVVL
jgi:hypothetical protein